MVLKEIMRQTFIDGIKHNLNNNKKTSWPPLADTIGAYKISMVKEVAELTKNFEAFNFGERTFYKKDNNGKVSNNYVAIKFHYSYANKFCVDKEVYR